MNSYFFIKASSVLEYKTSGSSIPVVRAHGVRVEGVQFSPPAQGE